MTPVVQMTYQHLRESASSVEVMSFARLRGLNDGGTQRADFHVLGLVGSGAGSVSVDFARHDLGARSAVWIRPGAVHRWDEMLRLNGLVVLFVPTAPVTQATRELAAAPRGNTAWRIDPATWNLVRAAARHLEVEAAAGPGDVPTEIPQILLSALLARLQPPGAPAVLGSTIFDAFQAEVEAKFREHHDVGYYAGSLGYVPRTLSRAVQRMTGTSAKAYITERLVLEAKRLLAHDRLSTYRCSTALGFADASNFSAFFRTATGERPSNWRARHQLAQPEPRREFAARDGRRGDAGGHSSRGSPA